MTFIKIERIVPNITVADLSPAVKDYQEALGMKVLMDHGWIVTLGDDTHKQQLSLITKDASASINPDISIFVDDVFEVLSRVQTAGLEIVHPLTEELWGVTRFFYRDSNGNIINVGMHTMNDEAEK